MRGYMRRFEKCDVSKNVGLENMWGFETCGDSNHSTFLDRRLKHVVSKQAFRKKWCFETCGVSKYVAFRNMWRFGTSAVSTHGLF